MAKISIRWDGTPPVQMLYSTDYLMGSNSGYIRTSAYVVMWSGSNLTYEPSNPYPVSGVINNWSEEVFNKSYNINISDSAYSIPSGAAYSTIVVGLLSGKDTWIGSDENDFFHASLGGDIYFGGNGTDTIDAPFSSTNFISDLTKFNRQGTIVSVEKYGSTNLTLDSIERLRFSNISLALDTDGAAGQAYRIYKAAFDRTPDLGGLGYWIAQMDDGMGVVDVAARFIDSPEFRQLYGSNVSNAAFITKVYSNVLDRNPDEAGLAWWVNEMKTNPAKSWQKVLADFSESTENKANVATLIANGISYDPWVG